MNAEFKEWLDTVKYDNSNILSPQGLAWEAWQAAQKRLTEQRDQWKAKYIQQNKDLGCEMMDPDGTIWDYAKKVQSEIITVTKQRDVIEKKLRIELRGHPDSELWGDAGLIAATMRCVYALDEVTEQRDRLADVLRNIMAYRKGEKPHDYWRLPFEERENAAFDVWMQIENSINQALQSLTPNEP